MRIKQHPGTGLWVREDGAVCMPPGGRFCKFRWTYGSKNGKGYMKVNYHGKTYQVHRLIAGAFLSNPLNLPTVDHFPDRNPANNAVSNLRWADKKMQERNKQKVEDSLARYGVRKCDNENAYRRAYRAKNPEFAEWDRARCRAYMREHREKRREWEAKQRALGKKRRKFPDGSRRFLTDEEFNNLKEARNDEKEF